MTQSFETQRLDKSVTQNLVSKKIKKVNFTFYELFVPKKNLNNK